MARYLGVDVTNKDEYFFISYNSEDDDRVSQYLMAMSEKGLPMWYDYGIEVGDKWSSIIADKIANSKAVIMFLSRQIFSKEESFVHKEWEMARDFFDKKIYVVILDDISKKEVPHRYVSWWIDVNHMQCIMASNYTVDSCADKIISATGYNVISNEETLSQRKPYVAEETNTEEDNKLDIKECVNETKEQNVNTQNGSNDINESKSDDFIIEAGVLKKYKGNASVVRIPDGIVKIGFNAFNGCESIKSITMPDCVTCIDSFAFNNCKSLESVKISDNVTSIDGFVFCNCVALTEVNIPSGVSMICDKTFSHCDSLKSITIPNGVTSIGDGAFYYCQMLQSVTIPDSVINIGKDAFYKCELLQNITIPDSVISIGKSAFYGCRAIKSINIPNGVTSIDNNVFYNCKLLQSVTIPDSVTSIGRTAFYGCYSLTNISIPGSVKTIGKSAFDSCDSLKSITFGGTEKEWKKINYRKAWYEDKPKYIVHFTKS